MKEIPLTQGKVALVDDEDYERVSQYKWHAAKSRGTYYAARYDVLPSGKRKRITMHRFIMNLPRSILIDHANRNGLDNRRSNLRRCTRSQNMCNRAKQGNRKTSSIYKGVIWYRWKNKWRASVCYKERIVNLGYFEDEIDAAKAYDTEARKLHGRFACLNFPDEDIKNEE